MLPTYSPDMGKYKSAFAELLQEELKSVQLKKIKSSIDKFIKVNKDKFNSPDAIKDAKKIANSIMEFEDDLELINTIADLSNLVKDSKEVADELGKILDMV